MKRIISLLLVLVMVLIPLSACKTEEKPADKVEETKPEEKRMKRKKPRTKQKMVLKKLKVK